MTQTQQHCSTPEHLLTFLRGQLSSREESELQLHLNDCVVCRERLEDAAADADAWNEAKQFFGNGALYGSSDFSTSGHDEATQGSQRIRQVLDSLGPTDEPASLGRIGGYEVTGVVGAGGMGVVLKAHDRSLDRIVAIKVMSPHLAGSGSARKRFAREAKAAAAVLHPNVIAIHSVASADANPYLVMPYVRGASLQKRIDSQGPLPLKDTLRIGAQIAAGLAAAHEQGLVHRDIKPANILLEEGVERVTITDFGLARTVDDASMTCSGVIAGTPQYMSPEQTRGEPIDARSDLFSLGSVLYAMCAGRSPFRAETTYGVLHRIANDNPTPVCEVNPDVPVWLGHIIARLMAKRPEDRFESAAQIAELLEGCLAHVQQPSAMPLPESAAALAPKKTRRAPIGKFIAAAAGAFALLFAGILIVLELNKGTLTIESEMDDVPIRIMQGERIVDRLTVTKSGNSVRVAAGAYVVEVDTKLDGIVVENDQVSLKRGATEQVMIRLSTRTSNAKAGIFNQSAMESTDSVANYSAPDEKAKIIVDVYGGNRVLGQNNAKYGKLVQELDAIDDVQVNFHVAAPGNEITMVIVRDLTGLLKQEALTTGKPSVRRDAISKALAQIPLIHWEEGGQTSVHPEVGTVPEADKVNLRFSETREVVLSMGTLQCMLDLDTGETCPAPARINDDLNKFDVKPIQDQPQEEPRGLKIQSPETTMSFGAFAVASELWDLQESKVLSALAANKLIHVQEIPLRAGTPNTHVFRTSLGTLGILQLVGTESINADINGDTSYPWGIRIRYKTLRSVDPEREANAAKRVMQFLSAVQENDSETIASIAKGLAKNEQREKDIATLLQESGVPKPYKTLFVNQSAVVALGPISSSNDNMKERFLLFTLSLVDERWSIVDIDLESKETLFERFKTSPLVGEDVAHGMEQAVPKLLTTWEEVEARITSIVKERQAIVNADVDFELDASGEYISKRRYHVWLNGLNRRSDCRGVSSDGTEDYSTIVTPTFDWFEDRQDKNNSQINRRDPKEPVGWGTLGSIVDVRKVGLVNWYIESIDTDEFDEDLLPKDRTEAHVETGDYEGNPITIVKLERTTAGSTERWTEYWLSPRHGNYPVYIANGWTKPENSAEKYIVSQHTQWRYIDGIWFPTSVKHRYQCEHHKRDDTTIFSLLAARFNVNPFPNVFDPINLAANPNSIGLPPLTSNSMPNLKPAADPSDDHDRIQGSWQFDLKSKPAMSAGLNHFSVSFLADRMSMSGPQRAGIGTFSLSPDTVPKQIECLLNFGETHVEFIGIYEFRDSLLRLCLTEGKQRPKSFDNPPAVAGLMTLALERKHVELPDVDPNASLALSDWSQSQDGAGVFATYTLSIPGIETISQGLAAGGPAVKEFSEVPGFPGKVFTLRYFLPNLSPRGMAFVAGTSFQSSLDLIELTQVAERKRLVKVFSYPDSATEPKESSLRISVLEAGADQADWLKEIDATGEMIYGYEIVGR